jgi:hypothetical protein
VARERARRLPVDPETGEVRTTRHGQLVGDRVEVFAPVVFEPFSSGVLATVRIAAA